QVRDILPIFLFAFILAFLLSPLVQWVYGPEGKGLSRGAAALIVYIALIALLGVIIFVLYHALRTDVASYVTNFPHYRNLVRANVNNLESHGLLRSLPSSVKASINRTIDNSDVILG